MSSRRIWVLWLAAMVILFSVSCWERDSVEVVKLRNAVDSLQQEVDALREDLAQRAEDADPPTEDASAQVTALTEAVGRVAPGSRGAGEERGGPQRHGGRAACPHQRAGGAA